MPYLQEQKVKGLPIGKGNEQNLVYSCNGPLLSILQEWSKNAPANMNQRPDNPISIMKIDRKNKVIDKKKRPPAWGWGDEQEWEGRISQGNLRVYTRMCSGSWSWFHRCLLSQSVSVYTRCSLHANLTSNGLCKYVECRYEFCLNLTMGL